MAMETIAFELTGTKMMLMHALTLANPRDPMTKEMKKLTSKRKKSDEDHEAIAQIEWSAAMYFDDKLGPCMPAENIEASIKEAAKLTRRGKDVDRALRCVDDVVKLEYIGPRSKGKMWKAGARFVDTRAVGVQRARVMRTRPRFEAGWKLAFTLSYASDIWDRDDIIAIMETAGDMVGLGDFRQRYGRFSVEVVA